MEEIYETYRTGCHLHNLEIEPLYLTEPSYLKIVNPIPHILCMSINIYTFHIFTNHCIAVEEIDETDIIGFHLHHLEIGPLYLPEPSHLKIGANVVRAHEWFP